ncbi:MAG TPA: FxLYD domain-containing protein [Gemmatimonadales bacterium]|nr:FxLYD domain-containing protein [Gemmatimonadales bacterium]
MRAMLIGLTIGLAVVAASFEAVDAADLRSKVKVEQSYAGLHPGLDPGLYVCAGGHLHVKGTVQNLTDVTLASVTIEGKAYDSAGMLLGTARPAKKSPPLVSLKPGEKREFDLEFLTVTGSKIHEAKRQEIVVIEARPER